MDAKFNKGEVAMMIQRSPPGANPGQEWHHNGCCCRTEGSAGQSLRRRARCYSSNAASPNKDSAIEFWRTGLLTDAGLAPLTPTSRWPGRSPSRRPSGPQHQGHHAERSRMAVTDAVQKLENEPFWSSLPNPPLKNVTLGCQSGDEAGYRCQAYHSVKRAHRGLRSLPLSISWRNKG